MIQPTPGPSSSTFAPSAGRAYGKSSSKHVSRRSAARAASSSSGAPSWIRPLISSRVLGRTHACLYPSEPMDAPRRMVDDRWSGRFVLPSRELGGSGPLELQSDLWLDQPDAHDRVDERLAGGLVSPDEAARLHVFVDSGFLTFSIDLDAGFCEGFDDDVSRFWTERPADLAISPPTPQGPTSFRDWDGRAKAPGYRIPDMHSHSDRALDLYLHPGLFRRIELIYGEPAIAFQSLYFEYGSQQALHRDPMFVFTDPPAHLLASWVALED